MPPHQLLAAAFLAVRERDPLWPAELLDAIASQIEALGDELLERGEAETALPRARLTGERARTCAQLRMFAQIVREGSWVEAVIDRAIRIASRCRSRIFAECSCREARSRCLARAIFHLHSEHAAETPPRRLPAEIRWL